MSTRRFRFWDATVMAAAITAGIGGLTAAVVAFLEGGKQSDVVQLQAKMDARREKCQHAYSILTDDALNTALSADEKRLLISTELSVANACRTGTEP